MNKFRPSNYSILNAVKEAARYESIYVGDNYVMKDHGDYVEVNIDAENKGLHISYNVYFKENGEIVAKLHEKYKK